MKIAKNSHIKTKTKAFCATVGLPLCPKFEDMLEDHKTRLSPDNVVASCVVYCIGMLSIRARLRAPRTVQVEMHVHSKQQREKGRGGEEERRRERGEV